MGLLRIAMVAAVGIALLPSDREQQQKIYEKAGATAEWVVTFCDRNAATCAKGSELWSQFLAKAEFGAKLAYEAMRARQSGVQETADRQPSEQRPYSPAILERESSGTLTPLDKEPAWRGNKAQSNKRGV